MFRITKKAMALVAVYALVFAACSKSEGTGGNAASAQSGGAQQKSAAATSKSGGGKSTKIPEPKLAAAKDFDYELTRDAKGIRSTKYKGASVSVIVPSEIEGFPVTEMDADTFKDYREKLVNVVLPDSCKRLPEYMFGGLGRFDAVKREWQWFYRYSTLKTVTLPADITEIPEEFFHGSSIESIVIPSKVEVINRSAFSGCKNLKNVDIQSNVLEIIDDPYSLGAFRGCTALESIRLPDSVKIIGSSAFAGCTNLKSINLPNDIELYDGLFEGCSSLPIATQARLRELGYEGSF